MRLIPLTNETWEIFRAWFQFPIPPPKEAILVAETIDGVEYLIGGTCIYPTDGPYVLFEHFALNPEAPGKLRHKVAEQIFIALKSYCTIHGKVAFAWVSFDGGVKMLEKLGFTASPAQLMTFIPYNQPAPAVKPPLQESKTETDSGDVPPEEASLMEDDEFDPEDDSDIPMPTVRKKASKKKPRKKRAKRASLA